MAENSGFSLPAGFGGLVNYKEEYESKFMLKPTYVVGFIILIVAFRVGLSFFLG